MRLFPTIALAALLAAPGLAAAQTPSPGQIQAEIAGGNTGAALSQLQTAIQLHPNSGVAWYLTAEAQDAAGNLAAARTALAKAEHLAPGLPFANKQDVAALQSHINAHSGAGVSSMFLLIGGLIVLFVLFRLFSRFRRPMPMAYNPAYNPAYDGRPQYQGGPGYGPGYAPPGSGLGGSLMTGLAAGAGFAAGERIIDDLSGQNRIPDQDQNFNQDPLRDDGLQGNPGWDDNSSDDNFDPGNNW